MIGLKNARSRQFQISCLPKRSPNLHLVPMRPKESEETLRQRSQTRIPNRWRLVLVLMRRLKIKESKETLRQRSRTRIPTRLRPILVANPCKGTTISGGLFAYTRNRLVQLVEALESLALCSRLMRRPSPPKRSSRAGEAWRMLTKCSQLAPALLTLVVDPEDPVRFSRTQPKPIRVNMALAPQSFSSALVKTGSVGPGPQNPGTQVNRRGCYTANGTLFSSALLPAYFRGDPTPSAEVFLLSLV